MIDRTISLSEAVALVKSGDTLALGGMNLYRRPVAFVRELLKTHVRDLTLLCFTASYESDLLIGAGRVKARPRVLSKGHRQDQWRGRLQVQWRGHLPGP